jgi:hypothetical protein
MESDMPRSHDKSHFFKFMSCETVKAVLENSTLRWTRPSEFNDPFDHQVSYRFKFSKDELSAALFEEIERLIYLDEEVVFVAEKLLNKMVILLRSVKEKIPKSELVEKLRTGCIESSENFEGYKQKLNDLLESTLNQSRVLCVAETNENVVMWSHYADSHKGICLRLECVDEVDTSLLVAKPVTYTDEFPSFIGLDDYVKYLTGQDDPMMASLLMNAAYLKHSDWGYENEWRLHRPHENEHGLFNDWVEDKSVFGAVYFGCKIDPTHASDLMEIIDSKYPNMEIYQASISSVAFKLEFERIK